MNEKIIHEVVRRLRHQGCDSDFIDLLNSLGDGLDENETHHHLKKLNDMYGIPEVYIRQVIKLNDKNQITTNEKTEKPDEVVTIKNQQRRF